MRTKGKSNKVFPSKRERKYGRISRKLNWSFKKILSLQFFFYYFFVSSFIVSGKIHRNKAMTLSRYGSAKSCSTAEYLFHFFFIIIQRVFLFTHEDNNIQEVKESKSQKEILKINHKTMNDRKSLSTTLVMNCYTMERKFFFWDL